MNPDDLNNRTYSKIMEASITERNSTGSDYEEDDDDLMGTCIL